MPSTEFSVAAGRAVWSPCWVALGCLPGEYLVSAEYRAWGAGSLDNGEPPFSYQTIHKYALRGAVVVLVLVAMIGSRWFRPKPKEGVLREAAASLWPSRGHN